MHPLTRCAAVTMLLGAGLPLPAQAPAPAGVKPPAQEAAGCFDQAYAEMQKKAYGSALPLYEKALALAPDRADIWNEYGICLRNLRRFPAAARAGWRAIQLDRGRSLQPWTAQANTLMETHEWKAAQTCLEKAEAFHKDLPFMSKTWLNLAFRMLAAGASEGTVDICRRAAALDPGNSLGWIDLGQALACTGGDLQEATAHLAKGLALAEQQKDTQRAEYARQMIRQLKAGDSLRPSTAAGHAWQSLPAALRQLPEGDAREVALPALVDHHYILEKGGTLTLSLPEAWSEAMGTDRPENQFSVHFTVPGALGTKVLFSPIKGAGNAAGVKATTEAVVKTLLAGSVEKELPIHELASPVMKGYWVLSTNRQVPPGIPAKGVYRHLVSVQMDVGGQQCVGTVLANATAPEVIDPCLAAFTSARKSDAKKD